MNQTRSSAVPIVILVGAVILFGTAIVAVSAYAVFKAADSFDFDHDSGRPPAASVVDHGYADPVMIDHTGETLTAPDYVFEGTFADGASEQTHVFAIPDDTVLVRATIECNTHDADLAMTFSQESADDEDWDVQATSSDGHEWVWSNRKDRPEMADGRCFVHVSVYRDDEEAEDIPFTLTFRHVRYSEDGTIRPGEPIHGQLTPRSGHRRTYVAAWPDDAESIRFDVFDATQDVDLFVGFERPLLDLGDYDVIEENSYCTESVALTRDEADGDTLLVTVIDQDCNDVNTPFTLLMTADDGAPVELRTEHPFPPPRSERERVAQAVVRLDDDAGHGSGVLLTDDGLVLTAQHVVGGVGAEVVVSILLDPETPPLEAYRATVIRSDTDLDVALVQIDAMLDGSPLPDSVRFPTVPVSWRDEPTLGDPAFVCGYHDFDEAASRDPVSWTTGVVSGWEQTEFEPLIRIDAHVASGASGGAVLDSEHRLVGVVLIMHGAGDWGNTADEAAAALVTRLPSGWTELSRAGR